MEDLRIEHVRRDRVRFIPITTDHLLQQMILHPGAGTRVIPYAIRGLAA